MCVSDDHASTPPDDLGLYPPPSPFLPPPSLTHTSPDNPNTTASVETSAISNLLRPRPTDEDIILFETGNPDTGTVICGTINVRQLDAHDDQLSQSAVFTMESVPGVMTSAELCNFIAPCSSTILHLRMLRLRTHANQYVVVVKLKAAPDAPAFLSEFRGKPYLRDLTEETCVIRVVTDVQFHPPTPVSAHPKQKHPKKKKQKRKRKNSYLNSDAQPNSPARLRSEDNETDDQHCCEHSDHHKSCENHCEDKNDESSTTTSSLSSSVSPTTSSKTLVFPHSLMFPIDEDDAGSNADENSKRPVDTHQLTDVGERPIAGTELDLTQTAKTADNNGPCAMNADCSVCLERMDAHKEPLITIFCNHTMHAICLGKWGLNWCPVCRHAHVLTPEATTCLRCGQRDGLWMCIVCAFVGCGFTERGKHAYEHFQETLHPFVTNLTECTFWTGDVLRPGCVWDYSAERFVSRLVASEDGKVVEVKSDDYDSQTLGSLNATVGSSSSTMAVASSSQQQQQETAVCRRPLLNGLLAVDDEAIEREVQTALYVSRMDSEVAEYRRRLANQDAEHEAEIQKLQKQVQSLQAAISEGSRERKSLVRKCSDSEKELKTLRDRYDFLKNLNETLLRDKHGWDQQVAAMKAKVEETEAEKQALQEQLRDVMLHLETQNKIAGSCSSAEQGSSSAFDNSISASRASRSSASDMCRSDVSELRGADVVRVGPSKRERLAMKANRKYSGT